VAFWKRETAVLTSCLSGSFEIDIESKWVYSHIKLSFYFSYILFQVITQFDMAANPLWFNTNLSTKAALSCSKGEVLWREIVRFAKQNFATHCESMACTSPLNTRIFASDFKFGEFHAILRGVFVKKIHNFCLFKNSPYLCCCSR